MIALTERERQEVDFAHEYVEGYNHGTPDHDHYVLIDKLWQAYKNALSAKPQPDGTVTVTVQIGNSDDRLTQREWSTFVSHIDNLIRYNAHEQIHFTGTSYYPASFWQNACWVIEMKVADVDAFKRRVARWMSESGASRFQQDSIAVIVGKTEFIKETEMWVHGGGG